MTILDHKARSMLDRYSIVNTKEFPQRWRSTKSCRAPIVGHFRLRILSLPLKLGRLRRAQQSEYRRESG